MTATASLLELARQTRPDTEPDLLALAKQTRQETPNVKLAMPDYFGNPDSIGAADLGNQGYTPPIQESKTDPTDPTSFIRNAWRSAWQAGLQNLPPGIQEGLGYNPNLPIRMQERPPEPGASRFVGEAIGGAIPSTQDPAGAALAIMGGGAMSKGIRAGAEAAPVGIRQLAQLIHGVEKVAGPRAANALEQGIVGGTITAPLGAIHEAQHNPEEWETHPATKLGKVMLAAGAAAGAGAVGGAAFGAMGKHSPAPPTDPILPAPKPSRGGPPATAPMPPEPPATVPWSKTDYDPAGVGPTPAPWSQTEYTPPPAATPEEAAPAPWSKTEYTPPADEPPSAWSKTQYNPPQPPPSGRSPGWAKTEYDPSGIEPDPNPWSRSEFSPAKAEPSPAPQPQPEPPPAPQQPSGPSSAWAKTEYDPSGVDKPAPWSKTEYTHPVRSNADAQETPVQATEVSRGQEAGEGRTQQGQAGEAVPSGDSRPVVAKPPTLVEVRRQIKELGAEPVKGPKAKLVEQLDGLKKATEPPKAEPPLPEPPKPTEPATPAPEPTQTSARMADMDLDRKAMGLDSINSPERRGWETALSEAKSKGLGTADKAAAIIHEINHSPRSLNDTETAGLVIRSAELKNQHRELMQEVEKLTDPADLRLKGEEARRIEHDFDALSQALRSSGTEKGRSLAAQKLTLDEDMSLIAVKARAKAAKGRELTPEETARIKVLVKSLEEANAKIVELQKKSAERRAENAVRRGAKRTTEAKRIAEYTDLLKQTRELLKAGCL